MFETKRIRIGNQTSFSAVPILLPFEYAVAHGFDAFEWLPDKNESGEGWTEEDISKETRAIVRETAREKGIILSVHASLRSNPLKQKGDELFIKGIEFARDIGAALFNIHFFPGEGIAAYVESIVPLIEILSRSAIKLSIENIPETSPRDFNELFGYLNDHHSPYASSIGMCLDIGHANLCDSTRNDYLKYIDSLDPEVPIIHMHMHENYGDYDSHLPIFTGPAGKDPLGIRSLIGRMKKRGFSGSIILEQWPEPADLLDEARDRLLGMIGSPHEFRGQGSSDFVESIVQANERHLSWRKRLEWIQELFIDNRGELDIEQLVYIAIYLRFIGAGEVRCSEDGGHYRPSNHARISQKIYRRLTGMSTADNVFIIRKIYPWLPSFGSPFMRAEPLTRIRDIAHRNDIPTELKAEIKLKLQNKLHRSAGPEDLAASETFLKKITAPGVDYPPAFVEEFKRFHEELKEFFNARSLDERLTVFMKKVSAEDKGLIREFLGSKGRAETREQVPETFELLTELRDRISKKLGKKIGAEGHQRQLLDIGLEDFSFVLLSRLVTHFDAAKNGVPWVLMLNSLSLAVKNLRLSGFDIDECSALESELKTWAETFDKEDRDQLLRVKATIDRCRRLADVYCDKILDLFPGRAERLGQSLGVAEHAIKAFIEGDIRGHPIFQFSKLVTMLLKKIRALAALPPWDVIVPGKVSGTMRAASRISDLSHAYNELVVALLDKIEGNEEIPTWVAGIIVAQETPLLSHLAVRARQRNMPFAWCDGKSVFSNIKYMMGKQVILDVSPEQLDLKIAGGQEAGEADDRAMEKQHVCATVPSVDLSPQTRLLPLRDAAPETGGNKAFGARRLEEFSSREGAGFRTPAGVVIPFGVMDESLHSRPPSEREYRLLADELNGLSGDDFNGALRRLKDIIGQLQVSKEIVSSVIGTLGENQRLIVRSSSNCEDGCGFSGAGAYDSVVNVAPSEVSQAICTVWASLWNSAAVAGRKNAGIPHLKAYMAVLIQQMIVPEFSFIMHTINPVSNNQAQIYLEVAVGFGETLTSGVTPGIPYRMVFDKDTEKVWMLAFASFSSAAWPGPKGGIIRKTVDYSKIDLSRDQASRNRIGIRLGTMGRSVENAMGGPQDIEGLISGGTVYLVQSRPQQRVGCPL